MTPKQAASLLGISTSHVRHLIRKGTIKARKRKPMPGVTVWYISPNEIKRLKGQVGYGNSGQSIGYPKGRKRE